MDLTGLFDRIQAVASPAIFTVDGKPYCVKNLNRIDPIEFQSPDVVGVTTLTGMVDFIDTELTQIRDKYCGVKLVVESPTEVVLIGDLIPEQGNVRFVFARAKCRPICDLFDKTMDLERLIIALRGQCVPTETTAQLVSVTSQVHIEQSIKMSDDGLSMTFQVRSGIRMNDTATIEIPFPLQPYRTFNEVEQPVSECIMRAHQTTDKDDKITGATFRLHTADGDRWKNTAMLSIHNWLLERVDIPVIA
jgi:hypothetical protein